MADRHRESDEQQDFDWLYGTSGKGTGAGDRTEVLPGSSQGPHASDDPEGTRILDRTSPSPRPSSARRPEPVTPPEKIAPTPGTPTRSPRAMKRRGFHPLRWVVILLALWLAYMIAVPIFAWNKVSKVDAEPEGARPAEQPGATYLLVGSDSREGLTAAQKRRLGTGDAAGRRTDTIMLLHTGDGPNLLMSIPRDSLVPVPGHGTTKINAAFAFGGPKLLVKTVEEATGIRVDDYVEIGFGGFVTMVNAVGGIEICPKADMKDPLANLDIKAGCQHANGRKALGYARSRHTSGLGDIDRAAHQREVVSAIGSEALGPSTFLNPVRYYRLAFAAAESVIVGDNVSPTDFAKFAIAMRKVDDASGLTCGVPIRDLAVNWDEERANQLFDLIKRDRTAEVGKSLCQQSGLAR